jgi:tRNA(Ile)-lysidine synthase
MARPTPVTAKEFAGLMAALGAKPDSRHAVAVSGGADSLALALLMAEWGEAAYLTFDHGLRKESATEAAEVGAWLKRRGLEHHVLRWRGKKPASDLQAAARRARYRAFAEFCRAHHVRRLVLAHTRDDQAETFLIRLFRGSGVDGLAAMAPVTQMGKGASALLLLRPFLAMPKARLKATLTQRKQKWIEDPSNRNPDFTRVRVRNLLSEADIPGLDAATLAKTAARMGRARKFLEFETQKLMASSVVFFDEGYTEVNPVPFGERHEEIALRALAKVLAHVSGAIYPPRLESLERLYRALKDDRFRGATLSGCRLAPSGRGTGTILVAREAAAIADAIPLKGGGRALFDRRFDVALAKGAKPGVVKALGAAGWRALAKAHPRLRKNRLPYAVKLSLPALYRNGRPAEVPQLGHPARSAAFSVEPAARRPAIWL